MPHRRCRAAFALLLAFTTPHVASAAAPAAVPAEFPRTLELETGSGRVLTLRGPAANVFVADPKVAEVRPASPGTLFVFGVGPGRTTVAALDAAGHSLADTDIVVRPSSFAASQAQAAVSRAMPGARIAVQAQPKGLVISGDVETPEDAARALSIARGYLAEGQSVEDQLGVRSSTQVMLRVRIVEMGRTVTRSLGIDWQTMGTLGRFGTTTSALAAISTATSATATLGTTDINAMIDALAQDNLARVLAEPNLTAMSGQSASFLAGGEFPIPVGQQNNQVTVEFKQYGVRLTFLPTVLASGRINLHVSPEVSTLTSQGSVQLSAGNSSLQIPALTVRRADTTVELGSGQSFAIAGLLQDSVTQNAAAVPLLGEIPVLGALFRSTSFQRQETELVVVVTPYVAKPVNDPNALHTPGENYQLPNDLERILKLRQVASGTPAINARIPGQAGFIVQ
jgi:pilus assembly protein CpaC